MVIEESKGSSNYQRQYYDTSLATGENPYGVGVMQDELQAIRTKLVAEYTTPTSIFIDVGAGLGESSIKAKEVGAKVLAIDVSSQALKHIREQDQSVLAVEADGLCLPVASDSADVISMWEILEHTDDPARLLSEAYRVLKHAGVLLLSTPNENCLNRKIKKGLLGILGKIPRDGQITSRDDHWKEYPYLETLEMVRSAGFSIEDWDGYGLLFPLAWKLQKIPLFSPLIKLHVYSGMLAPSLAQETYVVARCMKKDS